MKTTSLGNFREPYVRGPHIRYFFISIMIAFAIALLAVFGLVSLIRLVHPMALY